MRSWRVIGALIMVTTIGQSVARAEMSVAMEASMTVEYNDNIRLTPRDEQDAVGRYAAAGAEFAFSRPEREIRVNPSVRAQRYAGAQSLDDDDYFLDVAAEQQLERSTASMRGNFYRDTTLSSEIDASGLVEIGVQRERTGIKPAWALELTPESRLNLGVSHDKVAYDGNAASATAVDYDFTSASLSYRRELGQGEELSATLSANRLEAPAISNRVEHQGVQMDYASALAERLYLSATLGVQRSRFELGSAPYTEDTGALFGFRLIGEWEYCSASAGLTRSIDPSGTGTMMQADNLTLSARTELHPGLVSSLSLLVSDRSDLQGIDPDADRRVEQLQFVLDRRLAERWALSASYRIVRQRLERSDLDAGSSAVVFSLSYTGERATLAD
jgi:hypothetical protein